MKICIVGASGKLGRYMVRHALDRGIPDVFIEHGARDGLLAELGLDAAGIAASVHALMDSGAELEPA